MAVTRVVAVICVVSVICAVVICVVAVSTVVTVTDLYGGSNSCREEEMKAVTIRTSGW